MPTPKAARPPKPAPAAGRRAPVAAPPAVPTPAFLRRFFGRDRFAAGAGIRLVECGPGRAVARMALRPGHLNGVDVAQGGAVFTLADFAFAVACNSHGPVALAIDVSVSFLAATRRGTLTATARRGLPLGPPLPRRGDGARRQGGRGGPLPRHRLRHQGLDPRGGGARCRWRPPRRRPGRPLRPPAPFEPRVAMVG